MLLFIDYDNYNNLYICFVFFFFFVNFISQHTGFFTFGQLINVMPFMNRLYKVTVNGTSLLEAFEHCVSEYDVTHRRGINLLQISGEWKKEVN